MAEFENTLKGIWSNDNINTGIKLKESFNAFNNTSFGKGLQKFNGNGISWGGMVGDMASGIGSMIGNKYGEDFSDQQKATQSLIRKGLENIPVYGQLIAAASGVVDAIGTATGTNLSNLDKDAAKRAGIGGAATFNNLMNSLPGNSMLWGIWGGRTNNYRLSDEAEAMRGGYSGTVDDLQASEDVAGKRLLFGRRKANAFIDSQSNNDRILQDINTVNTMAKNSDYNQNLQHQWQNRIAGQNYLGVTVGKQGMKLMSVSEARALLLTKKEDLIKLQNGGEIPGIDTNLLPEGALHARKNNLSELNSDLEDATKKGIPVMSAEEGGETPVVGEQVAEIENNEIIFRLEVTKKLEELRKDGSEEAMIEAGRLVAEELIENTQDNTGQITEEVENG